MARYNTNLASSLAPHQYQHDLVLPASYIVVAPKQGHSTTFRVKEGHGHLPALAEVRRRGFEPLYIVRAKARLKAALNPDFGRG